MNRDVVAWPAEVDDVIAGDLTAALSYTTPRGSAVAVGVAPVGLRDRAKGTLTFTTSLGLPHKLERMLRDPRVALAYHTRAHGFSSSDRYVLVQGDANVSLYPDEVWLTEILASRSEPFLGPVTTGAFWDRWLREYYEQRVAIEVRVRRIVAWPSMRCDGVPETFGAAAPPPPRGQPPPSAGTGPRERVARAARRAAAMSHHLVAYRGGDGYPVVIPIAIGAARVTGFEISAAAGLLPEGGRRAGILAHDYGPKLVPIAARQLSGWLGVERGRPPLFAPWSHTGFRAPANKTLLMLANGWLAKRGYRKAVRSGQLERLRAPATQPDGEAAPAPRPLETSRLILRQLCPDDLEAMAVLLGDGEALALWGDPLDREGARQWIERNRARYVSDGFGRCAIVLRSTGEVVGDCGLIRTVVEGVSEVELGWIVARAHWGEGIASEAGAAWRDHAFEQLGLERIVSMVSEDNPGSRRVAEKLGMTVERRATWGGLPMLMYSCSRSRVGPGPPEGPASA